VTTVKSKSEASGEKHSSDQQFRGGVLASDACHHAAAGDDIDDVRCSLQQAGDYLGDLARQARWHGVSHLLILGRPWTTEIVVMRKRLQSCGLAYCKASTLSRIGMDIIVPIFRYVRGDRSGRLVKQLHPET